MVVIQIENGKMTAFGKLVPFCQKKAVSGKWSLQMPVMEPGSIYSIHSAGGPQIRISGGPDGTIHLVSDDLRDKSPEDSMNDLVMELVGWLRDPLFEAPELEVVDLTEQTGEIENPNNTELEAPLKEEKEHVGNS